MNKIKKEVLGYPAPKRANDSQFHDPKCPFTRGLVVKNEILKGTVIKKDISKSATIEWHRPYYVPKYERYEMRRSRLRVHNPPCLDAQIGSKVVVARTRPLSKTKHHVIIAVTGQDEDIVNMAKEVPEKKTIKKEKKVEEQTGDNESDKE
jgi:small subunit ribosomal protein S17